MSEKPDFDQIANVANRAAMISEFIEALKETDKFQLTITKSSKHMNFGAGEIGGTGSLIKREALALLHARMLDSLRIIMQETSKFNATGEENNQ